eukprot:scaffold294455_cov39-Prasinocladus_malaysianus.AAC.1
MKAAPRRKRAAAILQDMQRHSDPMIDSVRKAKSHAKMDPDICQAMLVEAPQKGCPGLSGLLLLQHTTNPGGLLYDLLGLAPLQAFD